MADDIGFGCTIRRSSDGTPTGTMTSVGCLFNFTPPDFNNEPVDVTCHTSPGRHREYIPGVKELSELVLDVSFDPGSADYAAWLQDYKRTTPQYYDIIYNDDGATAWAMYGVVQNVSHAVPLDDKRMATITIKISGYPDFISTA